MYLDKIAIIVFVFFFFFLNHMWYEIWIVTFCAKFCYNLYQISLRYVTNFDKYIITDKCVTKFICYDM